MDQTRTHDIEQFALVSQAKTRMLLELLRCEIDHMISLISDEKYESIEMDWVDMVAH